MWLSRCLSLDSIVITVFEENVNSDSSNNSNNNDDFFSIHSDNETEDNDINCDNDSDSDNIDDEFWNDKIKLSSRKHYEAEKVNFDVRQLRKHRYKNCTIKDIDKARDHWH